MGWKAWEKETQQQVFRGRSGEENHVLSWLFVSWQAQTDGEAVLVGAWRLDLGDVHPSTTRGLVDLDLWKPCE